ncbi:MAG: aspartate-semialdehyde dehydrogenase, partial [Rivularia sp. (in: cyanobacteria)]
MAQAYRVAILGATGAVGTELLELLEERDFPLTELKLLASERSAGKKLAFKGENVLVEAVSEAALQNVDLVLASAGGSISKIWAPKAVEKGAVVVDNSSAFRMNPEVPLVVPEVNPEAVVNHKGIIANPNCTTILMAVGIFPLHKVKPIKRIVVATYQSASG